MNVDLINGHVAKLMSLSLVLIFTLQPLTCNRDMMLRSGENWIAGMQKERERTRLITLAKARDPGPNWRDEEMSIE